MTAAISSGAVIGLTLAAVLPLFAAVAALVGWLTEEREP